MYKSSTFGIINIIRNNYEVEPLEKHYINRSVLFVLAWVALVKGLRGWRARVEGMGVVLACGEC